MILHRCIDHDLRSIILIFGSIGHGQIRTFNFLPFLRDNSISFSHTMMILHTCIKRDQRRTSADFGIKTSKIKAIFWLQTFYSLHTVTPFLFDIHTVWYNDTIMILWGKEVKGKGCNSCLNYWLFPQSNSSTFWHAIMILHTCVSYEPRRTSYNFGVKRSRLNLESLNLLPRGPFKTS